MSVLPAGMFDGNDAPALAAFSVTLLGLLVILGIVCCLLFIFGRRWRR